MNEGEEKPLPTIQTPSEEDDQIEDRLEAEGIITAPDGGYGWWIVFCAFCCNIIVDGIIFSSGAVLVVHFEKEYGVPTSFAAIAPSLLNGCYLLSGPLASALANQYGCHKVAMAGAVIAASGFLFSTIARQIVVLYITYGIIAGSGFGFTFLCSIVIVGQYFESKRALATGIAVCGSGIGTALISFLNPHIMKWLRYNWRLYLVFLSCLSLTGAFFGYFFKPLKPKTGQVEKVAEIATDYIGRHEDEFGIAAKSSGEPGLAASGVALTRLPSAQRHVGADRPFLSTIELHASRHGEKNALSQQDLAAFASKASISELNRPLSKMNIFYPGSIQSLSQRQQTAAPSRHQTVIGGVESGEERRRTHDRQSNLYLSNIGLPTEEDYIDTSKPAWYRSVLKPLQSMLDLSLLRSPSFLMLAFSGCFTLSCFFVPFIFVGQLAESKGIDPELAKYLVTLLGIVNVIARVICGFVSDLPFVDPLWVSNVAVILAGAATIALPFFDTFLAFALYCIPFASGVACFAALRSIICVELLGVEKLTNAYGLLLLFMGVAALVGPPFAAFLKNLTNSFDMSFYVMGVIMVVSGFLGIPLRRINQAELRRNAEDAISSVELEPLKSNGHQNGNSN